MMEELPSSTQSLEGYSSLKSATDRDSPNDKSLDRSVISASCDNGSSKSNRSAIDALVKSLPELGNCFHIHEKIGEGTFSNVYLASLKVLKSDKRFAIKHLIPTTHPRRIKLELDCLNRIGGKDNVISCDMTLRKADCVVFIMPYIPHSKFADYVLDMSVEETRLYMKNLFLALRRVHSFNVIHRDVKPSNFLYDRDRKKFLLVDFGLAQEVNEQKQEVKEGPPSHKSHFPLKTVTKRKREDDDVENAERPAVKRCALQTLPNDIVNKPSMRPPVTLRYPKQPLSEQQRKGQESQRMLKRQPLSSNASNIIEQSVSISSQKQQFQSLLPQKAQVESGASFVRVQNSQVQTGLFPKPTAPVRRKDCDCTGKPQVCNVCLTRKGLYAPRAGTPGFRPPEVLLKYLNQTTAVDMWAAGVIMLSILSGCYPFFRASDDISALTELITVFGSSDIVSLARKLGRKVVCSENRKPLNLQILCENYRQRKLKAKNLNNSPSPPADQLTPPSSQTMCTECHQPDSPEYGCLCESKSKLNLANSYFPYSAFDLLTRLLDTDPHTRISAASALEHPFITATD